MIYQIKTIYLLTLKMKNFLKKIIILKKYLIIKIKTKLKLYQTQPNQKIKILIK